MVFVCVSVQTRVCAAVNSVHVCCLYYLALTFSQLGVSERPYIVVEACCAQRPTPSLRGSSEQYQVSPSDGAAFHECCLAKNTTIVNCNYSRSLHNSRCRMCNETLLLRHRLCFRALTLSSIASLERGHWRRVVLHVLHPLIHSYLA